MSAGRNSEEHQIFDAARAKNQVELVLRECADSLLVDHKLFGASDGTVEFGGWGAVYEKIVLLHLLQSRLHIGNLRMARKNLGPRE